MYFNPLNAQLNPICHLLALLGAHHILHVSRIRVNPLNAQLNPICHLLALLEAHSILHFIRIRVKVVGVVHRLCTLIVRAVAKESRQHNNYVSSFQGPV